MWADLGALKMSKAKQLITLWIWSRRTWGEPARRALQQSSLERTGQETSSGGFKKDTVRLNRSAWSPGMQVDKFVHLFLQCKLAVKMTPRLRAALEIGMSLWPADCEEGGSIPRAEPIRRISVLSSCNWSLFRTTQTFTSKMQDPMVRSRVNASEGESDLYSSVSFANKMRDRMLTNYIRKRLSMQNEKNKFQDRALGDPASQKRRRSFYFIHSYHLAGNNRRRTKQDHKS